MLVPFEPGGRSGPYFQAPVFAALAFSGLLLPVSSSCKSRTFGSGGSALKQDATGVVVSCETGALSKPGREATLVFTNDGFSAKSSATGEVFVEKRGYRVVFAPADIGETLFQCPDFVPFTDVKIGSKGATFAVVSPGSAPMVRTYLPSDTTDTDDAATPPAPATARQFCLESGFEIVPEADLRKTFVDFETAGSCRVYADADARGDVANAVALTKRLEGAISATFAKVGAKDVVSKMPECRLYLASKSRCIEVGSEAIPVYEGVALGYQNASSHIYMLAASKHQGTTFGEADIPVAGYWEKVYAHEFFQGAMYALNERDKRYSFDTCPGWFVQGMQEYYGVRNSVADVAKTWSNYAKVTRRLLAQVRFEDAGVRYVGEGGTNDFDYFLGTVLIRWLFETKPDAERKALAVIASTGFSDCGSALKEAFGSPTGWSEPFSTWNATLVR